MSLIKKLAGETALYGLSSIVARLLNFLLTPLYTRALVDTADYGIVTDLYAASAFLMILLSYRMESAFFRYGTPKADRARAYAAGMRSLLVSTALITTLLLLFAQPIAGALQYANHPEYIRYFALILAFDCLVELPFARLRLEQRPYRFVFVKFFNIGLTVALNLFWLLFCPWAARQGYQWVYAVWNPDFKVGYIFLSNVIASVATALVLLPEILAAFRVKSVPPAADDMTMIDTPFPEKTVRVKFDPALWTKMMTYAGPLIIVGFAGIINEMLSRVMLKYLLPGTLQENMAQLGIFGANYKLAMLITLFTQAYRYAAEPFFFRHAADKDALKIQADATKWFTVTAMAGMLGILLFLDVVKYFLGKNYHEGLDVVPILLMANLLLGLYYNFSVWYRLKDRTATGAWISLAGAALTIVLNFLLIPRYGYIGASWVTLICYTFMCWATWQIGRKYYPVPYQLGRLAFYAALMFGLYTAYWWLKIAFPDWPVLLWAARILFFAGFVAIVVRVEKREFAKVRRALNK